MLSADDVRAVLDHEQLVPACELEQLVNPGRDAERMLDEHRARPLGDSLCGQGRIDVVAAGLDVGVHGCGTHEPHCIWYDDARESRKDNLVARSNSKRTQDREERDAPLPEGARGQAIAENRGEVVLVGGFVHIPGPSVALRRKDRTRSALSARPGKSRILRVG